MTKYVGYSLNYKSGKEQREGPAHLQNLYSTVKCLTVYQKYNQDGPNKNFKKMSSSDWQGNLMMFKIAYPVQRKIINLKLITSLEMSFFPPCPYYMRQGCRLKGRAGKDPGSTEIKGSWWKGLFWEGQSPLCRFLYRGGRSGRKNQKLISMRLNPGRV